MPTKKISFTLVLMLLMTIKTSLCMSSDPKPLTINPKQTLAQKIITLITPYEKNISIFEMLKKKIASCDKKILLQKFYALFFKKIKKEENLLLKKQHARTFIDIILSHIDIPFDCLDRSPFQEPIPGVSILMHTLKELEELEGEEEETHPFGMPSKS